jgi:hypothetical protein
MPSEYSSNKVYNQKQDGTLVEEKVLRIGLNKAIAVVITAIVGSAIASIFGTLAVANTIPFRVDAIEKIVEQLPDVYMSKVMSDQKWKYQENFNDRIEKKIDRISEAMGIL